MTTMKHMLRKLRVQSGPTHPHYQIVDIEIDVPLAYTVEHTPETVALAKLIDTAPDLINALEGLLGIAKDVLPEGDDYCGDGRHCDECGTLKSNPEQTQCDTPGCFYVRIREAVAAAEQLLSDDGGAD